MVQGFDAAAATAAYLAVLTPEANAKAQAYTQGGHWLLLWTALIGVGIAWLILKSGLTARVTAWVSGGKSRPWRAVALGVLVYSLAEAILNLPWAAYSGWWREKTYGLTSQPFAGWLGEWALGGVIGLILTTLLASLIYALMRRAPKTWWLWSGGVTTLAFLALQRSKSTRLNSSHG